MQNSKPKQSVSILIAEDDEHIALAIQVVIKKAFDCQVVKHALDGDQAWKLLQKSNYDLIISDWNMPGMTGPELLDRVRKSEQHANTPFLMLTARADKSSVLSAIQAGANDYISKPFQNEQLIEKLKNLIALSKLRVSSIDDLTKESKNNKNETISQDIIQYILERFKNGKAELPVLPHVYTSVSKAMEEDEVNFDKIIEVIQAEPAMSTSLITISNSAFYRGISVSRTLEQAVTRIGLAATKSYIFMIEGRSLFNTDNKDFSDVMNKLWEHSLATATCARIIAQQLNLRNMDVLFYMGLLHDIGKLALINILIDLSDERTDINEKTIHSVFEALHTEIGAIILTQWQFPKEIINIVKYHHDLSNKTQCTTELMIVHLANNLVRSLGFSLKSDDGIMPAEIKSAKLLNMDAILLNQILQQVTQDVEAIKTSV